VQLPTVNLGLTNFEGGFAVPGWFLQEFPDYYYADKQKDSQGDTVPGFGHLSAFSTTTHIVYGSKRQFLGGWLAAEVLADRRWRIRTRRGMHPGIPSTRMASIR
jgi:hypothetical protein